MSDKSAKKLYKAIYKPKVRDYLIAARKSRMTFSVSNGEYIQSHGWRDT